MTHDDFRVPLGEPLPGWRPPPFPEPCVLEGWGCRVEPLDPAVHPAPLWRAFAGADPDLWAYLTCGPFADENELGAHVQQIAAQRDPQFYAICPADKPGQALGLASYLRIAPEAGSIEVGWLAFSPLLSRTPLATAAMVLLMERAFALGYRRYEWKCNVLNRPSRRAAQRLGFSYEGVFRQAAVNRGRNRDTAWYSVLDGEWPALRQAYATWLDEANFDAAGQQRQSLSVLTAPLLAARDVLG
ncbi:GNAT family N-acetyltransferase [Chitinilyticum litopenaei]|uniref:GNAT family N-acetyltransferase n=1 Tax=Chitinilyticum litopenaei TaxID=1121276 RepID=UPI0004916464|nr:GNAT family protein [Chitinilyticum litopenaei]